MAVCNTLIMNQCALSHEPRQTCGGTMLDAVGVSVRTWCGPTRPGRRTQRRAAPSPPHAPGCFPLFLLG